MTRHVRLLVGYLVCLPVGLFVRFLKRREVTLPCAPIGTLVLLRHRTLIYIQLANIPGDSAGIGRRLDRGRHSWNPRRRKYIFLYKYALRYQRGWSNS